MLLLFLKKENLHAILFHRVDSNHVQMYNKTWFKLTKFLHKEIKVSFNDKLTSLSLPIREML